MKKNDFFNYQNRREFDKFIAKEVSKNPPIIMKRKMVSHKKELAFCFTYK